MLIYLTKKRLNQILCSTEVCCWMVTGERQASRIRALYLKTLLRQEIAYFDTQTTTGEVMNTIAGDTILIQEALGEKVIFFLPCSKKEKKSCII